jgi:hypothetical protein
MTAPDLTFRATTSPYDTISSFTFIQSGPGGIQLPVLQNEQSDYIYFRVYNNFALNTDIADAINVFLTVFDGLGPASKNSFGTVTSQAWIRASLTGYGESTGTPGLYTQYPGEEIRLGNWIVLQPEKGSNGVLNSPKIRAGSNNNGVGFVEFKIYAKLPNTVVSGNYQFAISVGYDYL